MSVVEKINCSIVDGNRTTTLRWQDHEPATEDRVLSSYDLPYSSPPPRMRHPYNRRAPQLIDQVIALLGTYTQEQIMESNFQVDISLSNGTQIYLTIIKNKPYLLSSPLPFLAIEVGQSDKPRVMTEGWLAILMALTLEDGKTISINGEKQDGYINSQHYLEMVKEYTMMPEANKMGFYSAWELNYVDDVKDRLGREWIRLLAHPTLGKNWLPAPAAFGTKG